MRRNYSTGVAGWLFIAGALMFWGGWMLLPAHIGTFFKPDDFAAVHSHLHWWIWLYRVHLFGFLVSVMAFVALAAVLADSESRVLVWPGVTVAVIGLAALATGGIWFALKPTKPAATAGANTLTLGANTSIQPAFSRGFAGVSLGGSF